MSTNTQRGACSSHDSQCSYRQHTPLCSCSCCPVGYIGALHSIKMTRTSLPQRHASSAVDKRVDASSNSLHGMPPELLQLVLDKLVPEDLLALLQASKVMAQHIMQHSSGKQMLRIHTASNRNWAATRQILQWIPPACLKVKLHCVTQHPHDEDNKHQQHLLKLGSKALVALLGQHNRQLPCILDLDLQGFILSSVVPPRLAATCPNLHTLQLRACSVELGSGQRSSRKGEGCRSDAQPASSIRTLLLKDTSVPADELGFNRPKGTPKQRRATRQATQQVQQVLDYEDQLKTILPNLQCLHLEDWDAPLDMVRLWAAQLTELYMPEAWYTFPQMFDRCASQMQQLHMLVLPTMSIQCAAELKLLLQFSRLAHVELKYIRRVEEDLSAHPCPWQSLKLNAGRSGQALEALAHTPLHSLKAPLELRSVEPDDYLQMCLPTGELEGVLALLHRLSERLVRCGVLLDTNTLGWKQCSEDDDALPRPVAELASISPVFGSRAEVLLAEMSVGDEMIQALAATHQHTLTSLSLHGCSLEVGLAHAITIQLPSLQKLELLCCNNPDDMDWEASMEDICSSIMLAMAQQPAGRKLDLWLRNDDPKLDAGTLRELGDWVLSKLEQLQPGPTPHASAICVKRAVQFKKHGWWLILTFSCRL